MNALEAQGIIQAFEYTFELAWNVMKDYLVYQGNLHITGLRDAIREAYRRGLVTEGDVWMYAFRRWNRATHPYNADTAEEIAENILQVYIRLSWIFVL